MPFNVLGSSDVADILSAGGGLQLPGKGEAIDTLTRWAMAAREGKALLVLTGMSGRSKADLLALAKAGASYIALRE